MTGEIIVRRYEDGDLEGLFEMIKLAFLTPALDKVYEAEVKAFWLSTYSREDLLRRTKRDHFYVVELDGEIVGSGAVGADGDSTYISAVFINPFIQGKGIGTKIMAVLEQDELCRSCSRIYLTAALSAGKFYQKLGYTFKYAVPEIVMDGCLDVVYMEKTLEDR